MIAVDRTWYELRALHARPPGLAAADPDRRAVLAAALRQSEEFFAASRAVTHASKPLPLFYALSQAGRAIAAAHDATPTWSIKGHGLRVKREGNDVAATTVEPTPRKDAADAFSAVTRAIESDSLAEPIRISELWAALPELEWLMGMRRDALPAVVINVADSGQSPGLLSTQPAIGWVVLHGMTSIAEVDEQLRRYAYIDDAVQLGPPRVGDGTALVQLEWPTTPPARLPPAAKAFRAMYDVAISWRGRWYLQPLAGSPGTAPRPLALWWALLIALSSLARYHPALWTAALDLQASTDAVELQEALDLAERRVPELVLQALRR